MKIAIAGDLHWSQYSSIIRKRGEKYSMRLENLVNSLNWFYELAESEKCLASIVLGDFFDRPELNSEEITALKEVRWARMSNYFIAGNHEMMNVDHDYSSANLFRLLDTGEVITKPCMIPDRNIEFAILPYILESERKPLEEYFPPTDKVRVIFSHNDISGIQMGQFISKEGFSISEIEANCDLFINGHLHNGTKVTNKIINCGNLTGQNFSEDAANYDHVALILDTDTLKCGVYENPFAFNFYKLDAVTSDITHYHLKSNAVCTIRCKEQDVNKVRSWITNNPNVIESRLIIEPEIRTTTIDTVESFSVDHIERFKEYIMQTLVEQGEFDSKIVTAELMEISK